MPRHRGKNKGKRGARWADRHAKGNQRIKIVGEVGAHPVPCGNYACESCRPVLMATAKFVKGIQT